MLSLPTYNQIVQASNITFNAKSGLVPCMVLGSPFILISTGIKEGKWVFHKILSCGGVVGKETTSHLSYLS